MRQGDVARHLSKDLARTDQAAAGPREETAIGQAVDPHPPAGGFGRGLGGSGRAVGPAHPFLTFHEKVKTHRVFARDCTVVAPAALLLFGGDVEAKRETGRVCLDGWLWLRASAQTAALFRRARAALDAALARRIAGAGRRTGGHGEEGNGGDEVVLAVRALLNDA